METNEPSAPQKGGNKAVWIVALLVILAIGLWMAKPWKKGDENKLDSQKSTQTETTAQTSSQPQSLKDLLASGKSQQCTYSVKTENSESSGTTFMSKGKMAGDFSSTASGKTYSSHMISDGTTMYTWVDGASQGYKMSMSASQQNQDQTSPNGQQNVDVNAKYDYHCSDWNEESGKFNLPSAVTFMDMSAMMQQGAQGPQTGTSVKGGNSEGELKAQQCAACSSLSGDAQTQCKAALSCP